MAVLTMANHGTTALLLITSRLVAVALSGADARITMHRDAHGGYHVDAVPAPELTCNKVLGVHAGETCFSVAQGTGLSQEQFLGFNPNINCENLFIGQWVCLDATSD